MCFLSFIENPEGAGFFGHSNSVVCSLQVENFSQSFLAHFFSAANFWSCKGVPHNGEMQKRAKLHIVNFEKAIDIILLTSASKKEQTSGEVSPLPEIVTGRKGNLTWH